MASFVILPPSRGLSSFAAHHPGDHQLREPWVDFKQWGKNGGVVCWFWKICSTTCVCCSDHLGCCMSTSQACLVQNLDKLKMKTVSVSDSYCWSAEYYHIISQVTIIWYVLLCCSAIILNSRTTTTVQDLLLIQSAVLMVSLSVCASPSLTHRGTVPHPFVTSSSSLALLRAPRVHVFLQAIVRVWWPQQ